MHTIGSSRTACAALLAWLAGCGQLPNMAPSPAPHDSSQYSSRHSDDTPPPGPVAGQRASFDSVDTYKVDAAQQVMRYNAAHTFSGRLPPMLPAVVVLSITVDHTGRLTKVAVQRSRDAEASNVALASMRRTGRLPLPFNLATGPGRSLTFSETFLFNADYRFQLRTLAPIQHSD
jgi:protein TonB